MSKRELDGEDAEERDNQDKRQHRQDDGNIDAALLDEANQYDTATTAVANATYRDLIQHDENEHGHEHHSHGRDHLGAHEHEHGPDQGQDEQQRNHRQQGDEDGGAEQEGGEQEGDEEEEELDDNLKDPDHIPDEASTMDVKVDDENDDDDEDDDSERKTAVRRGRAAAPVTGSEEWKRQRKDSHKEVERRRRENINLAINRLSDLLPVKENSKATILARAAEYIQKLKETESANIDKWTLQKLLSEQNQSRLTSANERLQEELGRAYKEIETLKSMIGGSVISSGNAEGNDGETH